MRGLIRKAIVSLGLADDTPYPREQITANGVTREVVRFSPYGIWSKPPKNALAIAFALNGRPDDLFAMFDTPTKRFKDLKETEVKLGNPSQESFIYFTDDGSIIIKIPRDGNLELDLDEGNSSVTLNGDLTINVTGKITLEATDGVEIDGDVTVAGNIDVTGDITVDGATEFTGPVDITGATSVTGAITSSTTITATTNVIGGGISLLTHTHPDPVTGTTGPPNP